MSDFTENGNDQGNVDQPQDQQTAQPSINSQNPPKDQQAPPQPPQGQWQQGGYGNQQYPPQQQNYHGQYPPQSPPPYGYNQPAYRNQVNPYQQPNSYQYNANTGWQQNQNPPTEEKYEWNLNDYDKVEVNKKKKPNRGIVVFAVSILCVLTVVLVSFSGRSVFQSLTDNSDISGDTSGEDTSSYAGLTSSQLAIEGKPQISESLPIAGRMTTPQVAKKVSPSVVGVLTYVNTQYFYEPESAGSGIIMSEDGYVITNEHVIRDVDGIKVVLSDGETYAAVLVGKDPRTDLAVLKIEAQGLIPATFGDSNELEVGETVVAIGNPAGIELAGSVTRGIVSAVNRDIPTNTYSMNYIQTDAAINPGNSGGPLVNEFGQVVGINSSKIVAEGYEGISFAIPINEAKPIIDDLLSNGRVTGRVVLGIQGRIIDEATSLNYNAPMGLQVISIENSDMGKKGVVPGDIITHIAGVRVLNFDDVRNAIKDRKAGDVVEITVYRQTKVTQGSTFNANVTLVEES